MDLFNQPCADVLVIGVGALGCAVAGRGALNDASEFPRQAEWAAIHTQSSELFATGLDQRLHLVLPAGPVSDGAIAIVLEARAEEWKRWCAGKRLILLAVADEDVFANCAARALAGMLRDENVSTLIVKTASEVQASDAGEASELRAILPAPGADVSPRALEALQGAQTLELVEACLGAWRADRAGSAWMSESFAEFLRWGRLEAQAGSADSVRAIRDEILGLASDAESVFLIVQGAEERKTAELKLLRDALGTGMANAGAVSVLSVEGRAPGDGLFWLRLARRAQSGNVVRLDQARAAITSAACAKI